MPTHKHLPAVYGYKFSILLSIFIHLFFVTAVEGAVLLSRTFESSPKAPLIILKTIPKSPVAKQSEVKDMIQKIHLTPLVPKLEKYKSELQSGKNSFEQYEKSSFDQTLQNFEVFQAEIDKRIQKTKEALSALLPKKQESIPVDSVMSHVSDLEKVPVEIRKDLLPTYLKQMRFRIARNWSRRFQLFGSKSGTVTLQYRIASDGTMFHLKALSSSGEETFQQSCLAAINEASPFDPLPFHFAKSVKDRYLTVVLTFHFRTRNEQKSV